MAFLLDAGGISGEGNQCKGSAYELGKGTGLLILQPIYLVKL